MELVLAGIHLPRSPIRSLDDLHHVVRLHLKAAALHYLRLDPAVLGDLGNDLPPRRATVLVVRLRTLPALEGVLVALGRCDDLDAHAVFSQMMAST